MLPRWQTRDSRGLEEEPCARSSRSRRGSTPTRSGARTTSIALVGLPALRIGAARGWRARASGSCWCSSWWGSWCSRRRRGARSAGCSGCSATGASGRTGLGANRDVDDRGPDRARGPSDPRRGRLPGARDRHVRGVGAGPRRLPARPLRLHQRAADVAREARSPVDRAGDARGSSSSSVRRCPTAHPRSSSGS